MRNGCWLVTSMVGLSTVCLHSLLIPLIFNHLLILLPHLRIPLLSFLLFLSPSLPLSVSPSLRPLSPQREPEYPSLQHRQEGQQHLHFPLTPPPHLPNSVSQTLTQSSLDVQATSVLQGGSRASRGEEGGRGNGEEVRGGGAGSAGASPLLPSQPSTSASELRHRAAQRLQQQHERIEAYLNSTFEAQSPSPVPDVARAPGYYDPAPQYDDPLHGSAIDIGFSTDMSADAWEVSVAPGRPTRGR